MYNCIRCSGSCETQRCGAVIRGQYDNDSGDWAHRYIVRELTATSMKWVAKDDMEYVQLFERVDSIPMAPAEE